MIYASSKIIEAFSIIFFTSFWAPTRIPFNIYISTNSLQSNLGFCYHAPQSSPSLCLLTNSKTTSTFLDICSVASNFLCKNLYLFMKASVTNHQKLGDLKQ